MAEKQYSKIVTCGHCYNKSFMNILGIVSKDDEYRDPEYGWLYESGTNFSVLQCPACGMVNIVSYYWHDSMENESEITYKTLYPLTKETPLGLPQNIIEMYQAAQKVQSISIDAYATLMRKILEQVCIDKQAKQGTLHTMLEDLANKNEIPEKLVKVAKGLKDFGNIGAHANNGKLDKKQIPILEALAKAILEYIYSAPYLAGLAEKELEKIKANK